MKRFILMINVRALINRIRTLETILTRGNLPGEDLTHYQRRLEETRKQLDQAQPKKTLAETQPGGRAYATAKLLASLEQFLRQHSGRMKVYRTAAIFSYTGRTISDDGPEYLTRLMVSFNWKDEEIRVRAFPITREFATEWEDDGSGHPNIGFGHEFCFGGNEATVNQLLRDAIAEPLGAGAGLNAYGPTRLSLMLFVLEDVKHCDYGGGYWNQIEDSTDDEE